MGTVWLLYIAICIAEPGSIGLDCHPLPAVGPYLSLPACRRAGRRRALDHADHESIRYHCRYDRDGPAPGPDWRRDTPAPAS